MMSALDKRESDLAEALEVMTSGVSPSSNSAKNTSLLAHIITCYIITLMLCNVKNFGDYNTCYHQLLTQIVDIAVVMKVLFKNITL